MAARLKPLLIVALLLAGSLSLAGCLQDTPEAGAAKKQPIQQQRTPSPSLDTQPNKPTPQASKDANVTAGQKWHFHNYWGLSPTITVFEENVSLQWTPSASCCPARATVGAVEIDLPRGKIVPPETGRVDVTLDWPEPVVPYRVNLSYKPANAPAFVNHGPVENKGVAIIAVSEEMADVPHRAISAWRFRLEVAPNEQGIGVANATIHIRIQATIGRPIFIDPPHPNRWQGEVMLPLAQGAGEAAAARAAGGHLVGDKVAMTAHSQKMIARVGVLNGTIVPEDATEILVRLKWTPQAPSAPWTLALGYEERNGGTSGMLDPVDSQGTTRLYRIPIEPRNADAAYAASSAWAFDVLVDGEVGAFEGAWELSAWVTRLPPGAATFPT